MSAFIKLKTGGQGGQRGRGQGAAGQRGIREDIVKLFLPISPILRILPIYLISLMTIN